ncbi:hypothetical protein QUF80_01910 [Desulfococcaceae bacterium HSG8]|nr:hypothetical protein [Desulfococcaceae bacterium HSG8]
MSVIPFSFGIVITDGSFAVYYVNQGIFEAVRLVCGFAILICNLIMSFILLVYYINNMKLSKENICCRYDPGLYPIICIISAS